MEYLIHIAIMISIYFLIAQSLNLVFGLAGLLNLGHISLYALAAYTTALMSTELNLPFFICFFSSIVVSSFCAVILAGIS